jgi:hypothetical protein
MLYFIALHYVMLYYFILHYTLYKDKSPSGTAAGRVGGLEAGHLHHHVRGARGLGAAPGSIIYQFFLMLDLIMLCFICHRRHHIHDRLGLGSATGHIMLCCITLYHIICA